MAGTLTLVPTPIDEESSIHKWAFDRLMYACNEEPAKSVFVIEDLKPGRRRWLRWKLPREVVDDFVLYNEHNAKTVCHELLTLLKSGKNIFLMSDGGLPAFCDPGIELVDLCHQNNIKVTSTPFCNSMILAVAMSGFSHKKFIFEGFLPLSTEERALKLEVIVKKRETIVLMDTPYRLKKLLNELKQSMKSIGRSRTIFLAMDLNSSNEETLRGSVDHLISKISNFKREFILVIK